MKNTFNQPLTFTPTLRNYIWGGCQLKPSITTADGASDVPLAEVWAIYEKNVIAGGSFEGKTLQEITLKYPLQILGKKVACKDDGRFPLLIKLLDCADWLSIQVHPNNEQALALEGSGHLGKTEAWHVLAAEPGARLIAGIKSGTSHDTLQQSIRSGRVLDVSQWHDVYPNDTFLIEAGVLHALGPGLLIYEVQQTSDLTYRVYDWDRPAKSGRELHIEKSASVTNPDIDVKPVRLESIQANWVYQLVRSPFFALDLLSSSDSGWFDLNPSGQSFHALMVTDGTAILRVGASEFALEKYQSTLIPAACEEYRLYGDFRLLKASLAA